MEVEHQEVEQQEMAQQGIVVKRRITDAMLGRQVVIVELMASDKA